MKLPIKPILGIALGCMLFITTAVEAIGPILFNFESRLNIANCIRLICRALFYSSLFITLCSLIGKRSFKVIFWFTAVYALFAYANLLCFRGMGSYLPLTMMFDFQQLSGIGGNITELIHCHDILYIAALTLLYLLCRYLTAHAKELSRVKLIAVFATIAIISGIPSFGISRVVQGERLFEKIAWLIECEPTRVYKIYGVPPIICHQLLGESADRVTLTAEEQRVIDGVISARKEHLRDIGCSKQNVVIMLMESLNSSVITPQIMPTLYELTTQPQTLYCGNVRQLTQGAMSIGGQLSVLSGLSGLRTSVFCADYPDNIYPSIAKEMKARNSNTYTYAVVSTSRNYWREDALCKVLGIDSLFDKQNIAQHYNMQQLSDLEWMDDREVFGFAASKLPNSSTPFMALVVPSNMHSPYSYKESIAFEADFTSEPNSSLREYYRRAAYLDVQIAEFIKALKDKDLYDNTLIVVTSDHQIPSPSFEEELEGKLSPYIPAIFANTGLDWQNNDQTVFCHSQIYPTILQLAGLKPEKYAGLYPAMTNIKATEAYDFENCQYATTTDKRIEAIYNIEELIIRSGYFGTNK